MDLKKNHSLGSRANQEIRLEQEMKVMEQHRPEWRGPLRTNRDEGGRQLQREKEGFGR